MSRSLSTAKFLSSFVVDRISIPLTRRGYAAAAHGVGSVSGKRAGGAMAKKGGDKKESIKNSPWVPDPKTGCYRPESHANDINVAELREALLNKQIARR